MRRAVKVGERMNRKECVELVREAAVEYAQASAQVG